MNLRIFRFPALWFCALLLAQTVAHAQIEANSIALEKFSTAALGVDMPKGWVPLLLPNATSPQFSIATIDNRVALRIYSQKAAGTVAFNKKFPAHTLQWDWRVDKVPSSANMKEKAGDDFAARVYVFFDVPLASLSFGDRTKIRVAKAVYGTNIPTAALCYVWDNKQARGITGWNPYSNRVRTVVLRGPADALATWQPENVDLAADFKKAFGFDAPTVAGIAIGNDTDQTGEEALVYFGDFSVIAPTTKP